MRHKRYLVAAGAAVVLAAGGGFGYAESADETPSGDVMVPAGISAGTVTLPTGDQVHVTPDGVSKLDPGPGRESQVFFNWPGEDVVVVPADVVSDIAAGNEDVRRYNVSALLEAGVTDAATASESQLQGEPLSAAEESNDTAELTVTLTDRAGVAPDDSRVLWVDMNADEFGLVDIGDDGTGTVDLPPGDYIVSVDVVTDPAEGSAGEVTSTIRTVTVDASGAELAVDAAVGEPVTVEVDRPDAVLHGAEISVEARWDGGGVRAGGHLASEYDGYVIAGNDVPGVELGLLYRPVLTSPAGAAEPFTYWLAFADTGGVPDDPSYRVTDDELAIVDTEYQSLGVDTSGSACDATGTDWPSGSGWMCRLTDIDLPSQRVNYYTPGEWSRNTEVGDLDDGYFADDGGSTLSPGRSEFSWSSGPLSAGQASYLRVAEGVMGGYPTFGDVGGEQYMFHMGYTGSVVISSDGEELGREDGRIDFGCEIPIPDESGRYTITATGERMSEYTSLATESTMEWAFDSDPVVEFEELRLPHVELSADGVTNGQVDGTGPFEVALEFESPDPAAALVELSFEVSFDDGDTWSPVELAVDGDGATGSLDLTDAVDFVSVRITGTDDTGVEFGHETIRSFAVV